MCAARTTRQDTSINVPIGEVIAEARGNGLSIHRLTAYDSLYLNAVTVLSALRADA